MEEFEGAIVRRLQGFLNTVAADESIGAELEVRGNIGIGSLLSSWHGLLVSLELTHYRWSRFVASWLVEGMTGEVVAITPWQVVVALLGVSGEVSVVEG